MERCIGWVLTPIATRVSEQFQFTIYLGRSDAEAVKSLKRKMELLTSRETDIEYEVTREERFLRNKRKTEVDTWLKKVKVSLQEGQKLEEKVSSSWLPIFFGDPVGKLQKRFVELIEQSNSFQSLVFDNFDSRNPCMPTKLFGKNIMENFDRIRPCLIVDNILSIGIYGMGGVGKTTLAKHIKFELERENYCVYWVTVSQEFSITSLQDKIANVLGIKWSKKDEEHVRANILRTAFDKMEKSVFIFDDVWEDFLLEDVGIAIGANRCRLIWTTRLLQVCHRMRCQRHFEVQTLDEQESWSMFKHTLGSETVLSKEVESIAKLVANRCAGLPLGIATTAASMIGVTDIREWNSALARLKSYSEGYQEMEDKVFPNLEYSFNRLRGCEIPCFLYCCLYPEDCEIEREKLIDLFIFAELIPRRVTMELECDEGHAILNKLVKVCLLEEAKSKRGVECVRMHDLIRDMGLRITSGRYSSKNTEGVPRFLVKSNIKKSNLLLKNEEWKDDLNAVSLTASSFDNFGDILEIPLLMSPNCRSLSTLIINRANIREIPDSFLHHMYGLKVLNLEGCERLQLLPNSISDMVNLTALLLEGCWCLESVPPIGKLKKLRILNLFGTKVDDVPQGLEELVNLERLYMSWSLSRARALPEGTFSKLYDLQHLVVPAAVHISDLRVLNELQLYMGGLTYDQFANSGWWPAHYKIIIVPLDLIESSEISHISFYYSDAVRNIRSKNQLLFEYCKFQEGLDVVLPPENLHQLDLFRCSGLSDGFLHRWIDRSKDLYHLELRHSEDLEFVLNLSSADVNDGVASNLEGALRNLRVIVLRFMPNLVGLVNIGRLSGESLIPPGTFSSLEELIIEDCDGLKKLFSVQLVQQCLQNLRRLIVDACRQVEEIVEGGGEAIIYHQSSTIQGLLLPKLQELRLLGLSKLENVCSPTIMIGGEEPTTFRVMDCPKLKRVPSFSSVKITYHIGGSKEWWNSLEWNNPRDKDAVQPYFKEWHFEKRIIR